MKIAILYGTETANAEMLADDLASHLKGHECETQNLSDFSPDDFDAGTFYLIVCSTYGDGELPASAKPFGEAMEAGKPDLSGVSYAVFGLGDSEYDETFNHGSKRIMDLMDGAGASRIGERITHDASGSDMAEDIAMPWADGVVELAGRMNRENA